MPLNISCYRTNGQVKAFPKSNNKIHAFGSDKVKALKALRAKPDFIMWLQDQYVTSEISEEYLADMLGIKRHSINKYISKHNLILKKLPKTEKFYPNTTQVAILRKLQRGNFLKQNNDNRFYLCNAIGDVTVIAKERNSSVEELVINDYIKKDADINEYVFNCNSGKYNKLRFATYVIAVKGITINPQLLGR